MRSPRLIFAAPRTDASLLPMVAAILALVAVAVLAFVASYWPGAPVRLPAKGTSETAQPPAQAYPVHPPEAPQPRNRMKSM